MTPKFKQLFTILGISLSLASCAIFYKPPDLAPPTYIKPNVIESGFDISGRFIIKSAVKNNSGNFTWSRVNESEDLAFRTPLGQTVAKIIINESGVATLYTSDDSYTGDDLTDEMQDQFGFTLPLNSLHYWVQGITIPDVPVTQKLSDGFVQSGWNVEYLEWENPTHPHILRCTNGEFEIKLLVDWS